MAMMVSLVQPVHIGRPAKVCIQACNQESAPKWETGYFWGVSFWPRKKFPITIIIYGFFLIIIKHL